MSNSLGLCWRSCRQLPLRAYLTTLNGGRSLSTSSRWQTTVSPLLAKVEKTIDAGDDAQHLADVASERLPFTSLEGKVSNDTLSAIKALGHKHMTPVQEAVFAHLPHVAKPLERTENGDVSSKGPRDLMVRAKTGTGKTLAFLVPALEHRLHHVSKEDQGKEFGSKRNSFSRNRDSIGKRNVGALILSPTRELATQISNEAKRLTRRLDFGVHELVGGVSKGMQMRRWRTERRDIVVATTGRLRDLMNSEPGFKDSLQTSKMLILDEADTMLDLGFREDIEEITSELPAAPERQTFVFSATISKDIQQVAREVLSDNHVYLNTVSEEDSPVHEHIPQYHTVLPSAAEQFNHVIRLLAHDQLANPGKSKTIVFLPTTKMTQLFAKVLRESKRFTPAGKAMSVYELHSKLTMNARQKTAGNFRKDSQGASVLVTSDVSARGVDYPGVTRVVQIGVPSSTDQYVHRVGRTGRTGGMSGRGDLVLLPWEQGFLSSSLADMPLKPITADAFKTSVLETATNYDSDPTAFFPESANNKKPSRNNERSRYGFNPDPISSFDSSVAERLKGLDTTTSVALEAFEDDEGQYYNDVEDVFASLLGYYIARAHELRVSREAVLKGVQDWTVKACGLPKPPSVSNAFLMRLGIKGDSGRSSSRSSRSGSSFGASRDYRFSGSGSYKKDGPKFSGWAKPDYDRGNRRQKSEGWTPSWKGRDSNPRRSSRYEEDEGRNRRPRKEGLFDDEY